MTRKPAGLVQTAIKLPAELITRLDGLATKLSKPGLRVTRSEVLRMATYRGLEALEGEGKKR